MFDYEDKTALVTGAASGLSQQFARALAAWGADSRVQGQLYRPSGRGEARDVGGVARRQEDGSW